MKKKNWNVREQVYFPLRFSGAVIGRNFFDFIIEEKIVVEIKKGIHFSKANIDQVLKYLKVANLKLALRKNFGHEGVTYKRTINLDAK